MDNLKIPIRKIIVMLVLVSIFSVLVLGFLAAWLGLYFDVPIESLVCALISGVLGLYIISRNTAKEFLRNYRIVIFLTLFVTGFIAYYVFAFVLLMVVVLLGIYRG